VVNRLSSWFANAPGDKKFVGDEIFSYRLSSYPLELNQLLDRASDLDVLNISGMAIKLKDLGDVFVAPKFSVRSTYIVPEKDVSFPALSFVINASPGEDIPRLIARIQKVLDQWQPTFEQNGLSWFEVYSEQEIIDDVFGTFKSNFRQTALVIFAVIVIFM